MRSSEFITELLDTVAPWTLAAESHNSRTYTWKIEELAYSLTASNIGAINNISAWSVVFAQITPGTDVSRVDVTNTGHELAVFSTVIDIIVNDIVPSVDPEFIQFSAELDRPSGRVSLYKRLIKRYLPPNYTFTMSAGEGDMSFTIKKDDE